MDKSADLWAFAVYKSSKATSKQVPASTTKNHWFVENTLRSAKSDISNKIMLDMFYSCFYSMLFRGPWSTKLMQFLTPVQTRISPIISTLHPRKEIWWQRLFRLQLSTFNNVSSGLIRPFVSLLVFSVSRDSSNPRANTKAVTWSQAERVKIHIDVAVLFLQRYVWCSNTNDETIWTVKQSIHRKKNSAALVLVQISWSNLLDLKNVCAAFDFANILIGPSLPPYPNFPQTSLN